MNFRDLDKDEMERLYQEGVKEVRCAMCTRALGTGPVCCFNEGQASLWLHQPCYAAALALVVGAWIAAGEFRPPGGAKLLMDTAMKTFWPFGVELKNDPPPKQ